MQDAHEYDVAVIGAGPAGSATALRLAARGARVLLVERSRFDEPRAGESLAPRVRPLLEELGLLRAFFALDPLASHGTQSEWGRAREAHSYLFTAYGCGWHVERARFDRMLAEGAAQSGAELRLATRFVSARPAGTRSIELELAADARATRYPVRASFVIDATGRGSVVARALGARRAVFDRLVGVGTSYPTSAQGVQHFTAVEATAEGWWYAAPLSPEQGILMLMTDGDLAHEGRLVRAAGWRKAFAQTRLATQRALSRVCLSVYPAVSQRQLLPPGEGRVARRWLSVGDASLAVDPISGSGVVRALRTAREAAAVVAEVLDGRDAPLGDYEAERDRECTTYLSERGAYYALETRFSAQPFWQRRTGRETGPSARQIHRA